MRPTALRSAPIFHPCAKPDIKLYQGRERKRKKKSRKTERETGEGGGREREREREREMSLKERKMGNAISCFTFILIG